MSKRIFSIVIVLSLFAIFPISVFALTLAEQAKGYRDKGYAAQQAGDIEGAISYYQKAASLDSNYAAPHNDLGIIYETKGWLDRAEEEYKKALTIDPDYAKAHTNLALLYERKGEVEKAAYHWMRRYRLGSPDDTWTKEAKERLVKLGMIEEGKIPQRVEYTREAEPKKLEPKIYKKIETPRKEKEIEVKKEEAPASKWARIGKERELPETKIERPASSPAKKKSMPEDVRKKQLEASLKLAEQRLREERRKESIPASKSAHRYLNDAQNFYQNGEYVRALDSLRKAKEIAPDDRSIYELENEVKDKMKEERISDHYKEGMRFFQQKNYTKAKEEFEAILSILPE